MNIRIADENDLEGVLALYKELRSADPELEKEYAKEKWRELVDSAQMDVIVADVDGVLAATCALGVNLSIANGARPFGIIEHVVTAQSHRRQGLAKKVLEFAINLAWEKNCYTVLLLSGEQLHSAHELYKSVGFKDGIERGFVITPE
ncbi:GNAT family N-acetyltransferase [Teredinibacter sp. KSP-S5-2]|uniref:GNAT family N-acetyltransferase n=1 Tax=Teredinibacter sp. KSP-S5-2 TaxID=3034506 RepID=UPI0029345C83|nr:GNAT family N-acetyltransferase [Teredinibacter sp. KSP-S5-2]WNO08629.1 GNAT family N-acetyltransferase [Teredinibacter sp. KSP-S5-2]